MELMILCCCFFLCSFQQYELMYAINLRLYCCQNWFHELINREQSNCCCCWLIGNFTFFSHFRANLSSGFKSIVLFKYILLLLLYVSVLNWRKFRTGKSFCFKISSYNVWEIVGPVQSGRPNHFHLIPPMAVVIRWQFYRKLCKF